MTILDLIRGFWRIWWRGRWFESLRMWLFRKWLLILFLFDLYGWLGCCWVSEAYIFKLVNLFWLLIINHLSSFEMGLLLRVHFIYQLFTINFLCVLVFSINYFLNNFFFIFLSAVFLRFQRTIFFFDVVLRSILMIQLKEKIYPCISLKLFIFTKHNIFISNIFTIQPWIAIIKLNHVQSFLRCYKRQLNFLIELLSRQNQLFHLNFALKIA